MLLLMAFWQEDVAFLSDVVLMLAGEDQRTDIDMDGFQQELGELMAKYRHLSLKEIQLGPILQEITEIAIRYDVPLPASLALTGKALAQMQLATAELDPDARPVRGGGTVPDAERARAGSGRHRPEEALLRGAEAQGPVRPAGRGVRAAGRRPPGTEAHGQLQGDRAAGGHDPPGRAAACRSR